MSGRNAMQYGAMQFNPFVETIVTTMHGCTIYLSIILLVVELKVGRIAIRCNVMSGNATNEQINALHSLSRQKHGEIDSLI